MAIFHLDSQSTTALRSPQGVLVIFVLAAMIAVLSSNALVLYLNLRRSNPRRPLYAPCSHIDRRVDYMNVRAWSRT